MNIAKAPHYEFLDLLQLGVEAVLARRENFVTDFGKTPLPLFQLCEQGWRLASLRDHRSQVADLQL
ncbi:MAG TPA: hypothetical protein VHM93_06160 [Candidatus Acidoferrum sp.]|nr:hypothetical protein [Candidatus Acidoferrum sp.]